MLEPRRLLLLRGGVVIAMLAVLALGIAWLSAGFQGVPGFISMFLVLSLGAVILWVGWLALRHERLPRQLAYLLIGAALLRLVVGAFWHGSLPVVGYATPAEQHGYVMADAYDRDRVAFELAQSGKPLWRAFQGSYHRADQYGGLLFLSAWLYRYVGGAEHQPLLVVAITAAFSALGVIFLWALARRAWDEGVAWIAAWGLALYPEAVLLGSSQMREAFTIPLVISAMYGLMYYWRAHARAGLVWMIVSLGLIVPFSPPAAGLLMAALGILGLALRRDLLNVRGIRSRWLWVILGVLALSILIGIWLSWKQIAPESISNPIDLIRWWLKKSAEWQAHLSERASGKIQAVFDRMPKWSHPLLLLTYGVVQPLLPAALIDVTAAAIWRGISIWRALGWTILLALLLYAPFLALSRNLAGDAAERNNHRLARGLSLVVWLVILVASYRSGGDMWDNPRYRAMFAGPQIALAAWTWVRYRRTGDANLRRALTAIGLILAWFVPWYLMRYIHLPWPVSDEIKMLGLAIVTAAMYWLWDWSRPPKKPPEG